MRPGKVQLCPASSLPCSTVLPMGRSPLLQGAGAHLGPVLGMLWWCWTVVLSVTREDPGTGCPWSESKTTPGGQLALRVSWGPVASKAHSALVGTSRRGPGESNKVELDPRAAADPPRDSGPVFGFSFFIHQRWMVTLTHLPQRAPVSHENEYLGTLKEDKFCVCPQHEGLLDEEGMFPSLRTLQS